MSVLEPPLDVLNWRLFQVTFDVMGSVLGNISNTKGWMLVHCSLLWHHLSGQYLDERRLSGTVWSDDSNAARERQGTRRIIQARLQLSRVSESAIRNL